eukprot:c16339_g1_i1.p1 GENE.c16339_g1_i1~~c16339_g1_i1.p1  ORF type:complete len:394 (+),score=80.24 c16339_g1_i1:20-1201(+)
MQRPIPRARGSQSTLNTPLVASTQTKIVTVFEASKFSPPLSAQEDQGPPVAISKIVNLPSSSEPNPTQKLATGSNTSNDIHTSSFPQTEVSDAGPGDDRDSWQYSNGTSSWQLHEPRRRRRKRVKRFLCLALPIIFLAVAGLGAYLLVVKLRCSNANNSVTKIQNFLPANVDRLQMSVGRARVQAINEPLIPNIEIRSTVSSYTRDRARKYLPLIDFNNQSRTIQVDTDVPGSMFACANVELTVSLKSQFGNGVVDVTSDEGDVVVSGRGKISLKQLAVKTDSGDIVVSDVIANPIHLTSNSGWIKYADHTVANTTLINQKGDVEIVISRDAVTRFRGGFVLESPSPVLKDRLGVVIVTENANGVMRGFITEEKGQVLRCKTHAPGNCIMIVG